MKGDTFTWKEAIAAIEKARDVFVYVRTSISSDGTDHHTEEFPITQELAIRAMKRTEDPRYIPNLVVSEEGTKVVIGQHLIAEHLPSLEHNDSNNGNF